MRPEKLSDEDRENLRRKAGIMSEMELEMAHKRFAIPHEMDIAIPDPRRAALTALVCALEDAVSKVASTASEDDDVLVQAFDLFVIEIGYIEPGFIGFHGIDERGKHSVIFSKGIPDLVRVVTRPKVKKNRTITGFSKPQNS